LEKVVNQDKLLNAGGTKKKAKALLAGHGISRPAFKPRNNKKGKQKKRCATKDCKNIVSAHFHKFCYDCYSSRKEKSSAENESSALDDVPAASQALCTIKSDFLHLIHQADITVNGKSIESIQPFIHIARHFQLISEMSVNDLATLGHSIGFSPTLDNPKSAKYQSSFSAVNGGSRNGYIIIVYLPLLPIIKQLQGLKMLR
jgi:hypothetical protein